jgi:hypothetical protein
VKPIDWDEYNRPPYFHQWLAKGETLKRANYDDPLLADIDAALRDMGQYGLNAVKGQLLDRIGKILAEPRNGNGDDLYRILLRLRIMLNTTKGTINDVIKVIKFFYGSEVVHIIPDYPAGIAILHDGEGPNLDFNRVIAALIPAGVSYNTTETFLFTEDFLFEDSQSLEMISRELAYYPAGLWHNRQVLCNHGQRPLHNGAVPRSGAYGRKGYQPIEGAVRSELNSRFRRDGEIKRGGVYLVPARNSVSAPVTYASPQTDILSGTLALDGFHDGYRALLTRDGSFKRDGTSLAPICDAPMPVTIQKYRRHNGAISRQGYRRDGSRQRDGSTRHFAGSPRSGDFITHEEIA